MNLDLAALPTDVDALHRLVRDLVSQATDDRLHFLSVAPTLIARKAWER